MKRNTELDALGGADDHHVRDKVSAQASMGLVSALVGGFCLSSLCEVDVDESMEMQRISTNIYLVSASWSLALSLLRV